MSDLKVFIGYDPREVDAYLVAKASIKHYNPKISVTPIVQSHLRNLGVYSRLPDITASTEFSLTRFFVPYLMDYQGTGLFMDCDVLVTRNVEEILVDIEESLPVHCVKHPEYVPKTNWKMDGKQQQSYPKKNWSSVMLFNCEHPLIVKNLSIANLNTKPPSYLHRMEWAENSIGSLNITWNYLVGYYKILETPAIIHYTDGGPWFDEYKGCEFSELWFKAYKSWA